MSNSPLIMSNFQNNPYCQTHLLNDGFVPILLGIFSRDLNEVCRFKALSALSCLTRDHPESQEQFLNIDGCAAVVDRLLVINSFDLSKHNYEQWYLFWMLLEKWLSFDSETLLLYSLHIWREFQISRCFGGKRSCRRIGKSISNCVKGVAEPPIKMSIIAQNDHLQPKTIFTTK